ncbi:hypothetical protein AB3N04_00010 (plasmid) [Alkalihalophilus sp. As8PL]|uniref:Uncharacterized protein n=1 Tax=Alkalihalophilus sp. As8PL TaxID=3237103 RepID=A0AB39BMY0_9BACI
MKNVEELASKLLNQFWLYGQYFEVGTLMVRNISTSSDLYIHQEYEVYKKDEANGCYRMFESVTITYFEKSCLAEWFNRYEEMSIEDMTLPGTKTKLQSHDRKNLYRVIPFSNFEAYKEAFEEYQLTV